MLAFFHSFLEPNQTQNIQAHFELPHLRHEYCIALIFKRSYKFQRSVLRVFEVLVDVLDYFAEILSGLSPIHHSILLRNSAILKDLTFQISQTFSKCILGDASDGNSTLNHRGHFFAFGFLRRR